MENTNTMKSSFLDAIDRMSIRNVSIQNPEKGEMLLRVKSCAICGSDIRIFHHGNDRVTYPAVLGHEMSGEIIALGDQTNGFSIGDRVCIGADIPSMLDDWSKNGMGNLSDINYAMGYQFPGGFSEYCLLNKLTVEFGPIAKIPDHISYDEACLTEPLACCINGLERTFMEPGKSVLVIGAGPIGILLCKTAETYGASSVVLVDNNEFRVDKARELKIPFVYNTEKDDLLAITKKITGNKGFNIILTACPSPDIHEIAVDLLSKRGVLNLFGGLPAQSRNISISSNSIHYKEAYITGSHGSSPRQFKLALELIANGRIEVKSLITHQFPLDKIEEAFKTVEAKEGLKVIIKP